MEVFLYLDGNNNILIIHQIITFPSNMRKMSAPIKKHPTQDIYRIIRMAILHLNICFFNFCSQFQFLFLNFCFISHTTLKQGCLMIQFVMANDIYIYSESYRSITNSYIFIFLIYILYDADRDIYVMIVLLLYPRKFIRKLQQ